MPQVFLRVMGMKPSQGLHLDPIDAEKPHLKIFLGAPSEILAPVTPGESQGTKIFGSNFCSHDPILCIFGIGFAKKGWKIPKTSFLLCYEGK